MTGKAGPRYFAQARGQVVRCAPLLAEPREWFDSIFDWDSHVTVVDMFSGAGGLSFGFDSVPSMAVVGAFEIDTWACETHAANIRSAICKSDIRSIDSFERTLKESGIRRVDVLAGGPPCQGFSRLGKGALRRLALDDGRSVDTRDPRNWLFREFLRAVRELSPQVVVMENVPEMAYYGTIVEEIREVFAEFGYCLDDRVLRADHYGVPQRRRRLFLIANRYGLTPSWEDPDPHRWTLRDAIADLPAIPAGHTREEIRRRRPERDNAYLRRMRQGLQGNDVRGIRAHVTRAHRAEDIEAFHHMREGDTYAVVPPRLRRYRSDIFVDKYHRMVFDEPAWTVTAHLAKDGYKYIHPSQHRTLSVREAARIQSFPDRFRFAGSRTDRYRQIGNAVPPLLAEAVARTVLPLVR
jgi:DNA (cytosine-5)-methyltransferase 1